MTLPVKAVVYISCVITIGASLVFLAAVKWVCLKPLEYSCLLALTILFSTLKVKIPRITGTYSANSAFVLIAASQFGFSETVALALCSGTVQCLWRAKEKPTVLQVLFNASVFAASATAAFEAYHAIAPSAAPWAWVGGLVYAMLLFFLGNTLLVSGVIAIIEEKPLLQVWTTWHIWSLAYYAANALIAFLMIRSGPFSIRIAAIATPVICYLFFYYRLLLKARLEAE
jgi:hypothetical protein